MIAAALQLLLLALSPAEGLQGGPIVEKSGLFEYVRPEGWTRVPIGDGSARLLPPGGGTTALRFLNPEAWSGTAEEFHLALLKRLKLDSEVLAGGTPQRFGAFLRSENTLGHGRKVQLYMRLYTAKVGKLWQGAYYVALTETGYAQFVGAAEGIIRSIVLPGARERVGAIEFAVPAGWTRREGAPEAPVVLLPPGIPEGSSVALSILPARTAEVSPDEHHEIMWKVLTDGSVILGRPEQAQRGAFRSTRVILRNRAGERGWLALYTAKHGTTAETLVFTTSSPDFWERFGAQAEGLVAGITFVAGAEAPGPVEVPKAPSGPRPIPEGVKLAGVWLRTASPERVDLQPDGFGPEPRRERILLALWENGLAYRGNAADAILSSPGGIREGLAAVDAAALAARAVFDDLRFGRWSGTSDGLVVEGFEGGALRLVREGTALKGPEAEPWLALAPVDGLRLDGVYVSAREGLPARSITLRADGTFEVERWDGLGNESFPAKGKGTYELRKSSLILRFEGLAPQALDLLAGFGAPSESRGLRIAGAVFVRR